MRRRTAVNLGLAAAAAILGAAVLLETGSEPRIRRLSTVSPTTVTRLRLEPVGAPPMTLSRHGERWQIDRPGPLAADGVRVATLLGLLGAPSLGGFRAAGTDLATLGLDPPRARLEVDGRAFALGATEPLDGRRYVLLDGEVHLVADGWFPFLRAGTATFADPRPLAPEPDPIEIRFRGGPGDPDPRRLAAWKNARAAYVRSYDAALSWGVTVSVRNRGEATARHFRVAGGEGEVVIGWPERGVQFHFPGGTGEALAGPD